MMEIAMEEFIARENIKRFRAQLRTSSDADQKSVLHKLLDAEEKKLQQARAAGRTAENS
jgi:hypothetical protein